MSHDPSAQVAALGDALLDLTRGTLIRDGRFVPLRSKSFRVLCELARKSGRAVAGFEKVKGWLAEGRAKVLLQASDGSERGKGKLWTPTGGRWFGCLTASELGLSFGRDHVIHGALAAGGLTDKVILEAGRLTGLRGHDGSNTAAGKE